MSPADDTSTLGSLHRLLEHYTPDGTLGRVLFAGCAGLVWPLLLFAAVTAGSGIVGLVGTAMMTVVFLIAQSVGAFALTDFAILTELLGLEAYVPSVLFGFLLFLAGGMVPWPLLFASLMAYLPGKSSPVSGAFFGATMWTGFVLAFYTDQTGLTLVLYALLTLVAHVVYGMGLGAVFDYFENRPDSIV